MADRSRSRSPDRRATDDQHHSADAQNGDNGDETGAGPTGDEVKLYVGNLDYGTLACGIDSSGNGIVEWSLLQGELAWKSYSFDSPVPLLPCLLVA
jgi:hypothetical protein